MAQDRPDGLLGLRPASAGTGPVQASWWASGVSGRVMPTMRRDVRAPDAGAADDDVGGDLARSVTTPVTRPSVDRDVEDLVPGAAAGRPASAARRICASTARTALARPSVGTSRPPRTTLAVHQRVLRDALVGGPAAAPRRPRRSASRGGGAARRARSGVVATSSPPTCRKHGSPSTLEAAQLLDGVAGELGHGLGRVRLEHQARGVRGGAAGGAGRSPWSTTVTSVQPRAVSSSASAAPTTPAPMMTTRGPVMPTSIVAPDATQCFFATIVSDRPERCQEVRTVRGAGRTAPYGACPPGSRAAPGGHERVGQRVRTARP